MTTAHRSTRRKLVSASATLAVIALAGIALAAPTAQASKAKSKPKPKPIFYAGKATAAGSWRANEQCGNFDHVVYQYGATFYPVDLGVASSFHYTNSDLDARTRSGNGTLDWDHGFPACLPGGSSPQSCPLGAETPPPGLHAGDEDGHFSEVKPGDPAGSDLSYLSRGVKVTLVPPLIEGGSCSGFISGWGGGGPGCPDPHGFIPATKIGRPSITVSIAGNCNTSDGSGRSLLADTTATLTLTRLKSKKH